MNRETVSIKTTSVILGVIMLFVFSFIIASIFFF